jgi:hypothetical protein
VKKRIGRLAYLLELPSHWRIHPVISVAQREPCPSSPDPYDCPRPDHPNAIETEGDTPQWKSYEVERIVDKRMRTYGSKKVAQYLLKWKGYGPEWNEWRSITKLGNCIDLVEDYESGNIATVTGIHHRRRASDVVPPAEFITKQGSGSTTSSHPKQGGSSTVLRNPMVVIPIQPRPTSSLPLPSADSEAPDIPSPPPLRRSGRIRTATSK